MKKYQHKYITVKEILMIYEKTNINGLKKYLEFHKDKIIKDTFAYKIKKNLDNNYLDSTIAELNLLKYKINL